MCCTTCPWAEFFVFLSVRAYVLICPYPSSPSLFCLTSQDVIVKFLLKLPESPNTAKRMLVNASRCVSLALTDDSVIAAGFNLRDLDLNFTIQDVEVGG